MKINLLKKIIKGIKEKDMDVKDLKSFAIMKMNLFTRIKLRIKGIKIKNIKIKEYDVNDLRGIPFPVCINNKSSSKRPLMEISKEDIIKFIK